MLLIKAMLPLLEAAAAPSDPARVVNVGSIDGLRVPPMPTYAYSASKAGLHHLTRVLARELGPRGITVNTIAPGPSSGSTGPHHLVAPDWALSRGILDLIG